MTKNAFFKSMKIPANLRLFLLVVTAFLLFSYLSRNILAGDSMIHLVYGRNLAHGRFMQFNDGEVSFGSSSIIWTMISAIPYILQSDDYTAIYIQKALSLLVFISCIIWLGRSRFFQFENLEYIVLVLFWFGLSKFIQFATVGMETPFAILLLLLVVNNSFSLFSWIQAFFVTSHSGVRLPQVRMVSSAAKFLVGGICSGLLILTRLELSIASVIVVVLILMSVCYWRTKNSGSSTPMEKKRTLFALGLVGLYVLGMLMTVTPYLGYMYFLTGSFVSSSAISRLYLAQNEINSAIHLMWIFYLNTKLIAFGLVNFPLFFAAFVGISISLKPWPIGFDSGLISPENNVVDTNSFTAHTFTVALCMCIIIALSSYFLFIFPGFQGARYFMPVLALIVVWSAKGVVAISKWISERIRISPKIVGMCLVGFILLSHGVFNQLYTPIVFQIPSGVSYAETAQFISSNIPAGKSVLVYEVQIKLNLPNNRIIAEDGVTDGIILRYYARYPDPAQAVEQFLLETRPDFIISGVPREGLTPRVKNTLLGKLQTLARETSLDQTIWLNDRIGATEVYKDPSLPYASQPAVEKIYMMTYR